MARSSLGPRPGMTTMFLRGTRKRSRTFTLASVSRRAAGGPLEPLGVLHSIERVVVIAAPLLMMTLMIIGLSQGRERAQTEGQMVIV